MPEFMGIKITRAQESARHAYRRALEKAVRGASKGGGWRTLQGCLFSERGGWFVSVCPSISIFDKTTKAIVSAKPMAIDPIFWDIVGLPENNDAPLSFRLNGAWTCQPPPFNEIAIEEDFDANIVAARLLDKANECVSAVTRWSIDDFLQLCRNSGATEDRYLACVVTALLALGRGGEALDICRSAQARGSHGGFGSPDGSFVEMATRWITASLTNATRH